MEKIKSTVPTYAHCEVPSVASTSMDWFLAKEGSKTGIQSRRLRVRDVLGVAGNAHLERHSLGHHGSFQLEAPSVLMCLLTDVRWHGAYTSALGTSFATASLPDFVRSPAFVELANETTAAVRAGMGSLVPGTSLSMAINRTICALGNEELLQSVAMDYSEVVRGVADALPSVERYAGQVVWIDGRDALVSLEVGEEDEEETRIVDADYLSGMGIDTDGQPIVAIDQRWSPDAGRISYYQPAVVVTGEDPAEIERWERVLREAERPPPRDRGAAVEAA